MAIEYFSNVKVVGTSKTYNDESGTCIMIYNTSTGKYEAVNANTFVNGGATTSGFDNQDTSATGSAFTPLVSKSCISVNLLNNTGVTIDVKKDANYIQIPSGTSILVRFITNANEVSIRRSDLSGTGVKVYYEWEA